MSTVLNKVVPIGAAGSSRDAGDEIQTRYSRELVIALSGPVGCGMKLVRDELMTCLRAHNYEVVHIQVSGAFRELANGLGIAEPAPHTGEFDRITKAQDLGNQLRMQLGDDLAAQIAMSQIAHDRTSRHTGEPVEKITPGRVAYVVDQLKNPREVALLRHVYGNLFYMIGVLSSYARRKHNLKQMGMEPVEVEALIDRDWAETDGGGQQLEKTLKLSDFFVRNYHDNTDELRVPITRFIELAHGKNGLTPTVNERGMYAAFSASLRSACLSRQVGASIVDKQGKIIATGCNDVPKSGGGLYEAGAAHDQRCVFRDGGQCHNDKHKDRLRDEIEKLLREGNVDAGLATKLAGQIRTRTRLRDLIEFSRAVHAEMDAIISAARAGGNGVQDCTLFTTTYPCHSCARHIVAAGIRAVYFIEPYGKSLAVELHDDSIDHNAEEAPDTADAAHRVAFLHFDGVAPRRFSDLFSAAESRKDSKGMKVPFLPASASQSMPELLDNYRELEAKLIQRMKKKLARPTDTPAA